jgi:hypothetical protein
MTMVRAEVESRLTRLCPTGPRAPAEPWRGAQLGAGIGIPATLLWQLDVSQLSRVHSPGWTLWADLSDGSILTQAHSRSSTKRYTSICANVIPRDTRMGLVRDQGRPGPESARSALLCAILAGSLRGAVSRC